MTKPGVMWKVLEDEKRETDSQQEIMVPEQYDTVCKSCGESIFMIKMESFKWMPVNRKKVRIVVIQKASNLGHVESGYESHFSTCPGAARHRKKGGK